MKQSDVCVIGGGIMGLFIAHELSESGKKIVLLEKKEIGAGATGACDDMILLQSKKPGINLQLALESLEIYRTLEKDWKVELGFKSDGGMILIEDEGQLKVMESFVKQQQAEGLPVEILGQRDVRKRQPHVNSSIIASTYSPLDSQIDPLLLMRHLVKRICRMGGEVLRPADVCGIEKKGDTWHISTLQGHQIVASQVVNACGPWAKVLGKKSDIYLPIEPRKGQLAITEPIAPLGSCNIWSAAYVASKLDPSILPYRNEYHRSIGLGFSFTRAKEGNYIIGSTREQAGFDKTTSERAIREILQQAAFYFPILKRVHVIRTIAGFRPASADGLPLVGEVRKQPGYFVAAGHEGDGIALAPITAKKLVDQMLGRKHYPFMEALSPERYHRTKE